MAAPVRDPLLEGHVGRGLEDGDGEGGLLVVPRVERGQERLQDLARRVGEAVPQPPGQGAHRRRAPGAGFNGYFSYLGNNLSTFLTDYYIKSNTSPNHLLAEKINVFPAPITR